jgi:hypothetical protein
LVVFANNVNCETKIHWTSLSIKQTSKKKTILDICPHHTRVHNPYPARSFST